MKQTISIIYPPPPQPYKNNNNKCNKTPQKLNGFQCGPLTGRHPPPPPHTHTFPPPSFLPFLLCNISNIRMTFRWRADGWSTLCAGWDRVCPCLVPPSSSFALKRFLMFCKTLVRKMHIIIQQNISCDVVIIA